MKYKAINIKIVLESKNLLKRLEAIWNADIFIDGIPVVKSIILANITVNSKLPIFAVMLVAICQKEFFRTFPAFPEKSLLLKRLAISKLSAASS